MGSQRLERRPPNECRAAFANLSVGVGQVSGKALTLTDRDAKSCRGVGEAYEVGIVHVAHFTWKRFFFPTCADSQGFNKKKVYKTLCRAF